MFRLALIVAGLLLIASTSALVTMHFAIHGAEVSIPDLRGLTLPAATQHGALAGVDLHVEGKLYSTTLAAGRVLAQSPEPGAVVRRDWTVRVVESLGPERVRIPNVLGQDERTASIGMRRLGLELGTVARVPDPLVAPGTVLAQDPPPDAAGVEQPSVGLLVAAGQVHEADAWVMPDWVGSSAAAAQAALSKAGLPPAQEHPGVVSGGATPAAAAGTILRQSPAAGARLSAQTTVVLEVAP